MDYYTVQEKILFVKWYFSGNSYARVSDLFSGFFPNRHVPSRGTIQRIIERFNLTGNLNKPCKCTQERAGNQEDNKEMEVLIHVIDNKNVSLREVGTNVGISHVTVRNILKKQTPPFKSFKYGIQHEILERDKYPRMVMCEILMNKCNEDRYFLSNIMFTDECSFSTHGIHNRQTFRYWSTENLHLTRKMRTQYRKSVNTWIGILGHRIIGPYFIEGSLDGQKYLALLQNHLFPDLENLDINHNNIWFQQDGCPAHNSGIVRNFINNVFPNRWIGRNGPIPWAARSPDISPNDFFLWGYLKNQLYKNNFAYANVDDLKEAIREKCATISPQMLANVRRSFYDRLGYCLAANGALFEHLI